MRGLSLGVLCIITVLRILRAEEVRSHNQTEKTLEKREIYDYSFSADGGALGYHQPSFRGGFTDEHKHEDNHEVHENVKTIIVTKKVPVPYAVHVEKKVPYPVKVTVRRPYTVYIPKPYLVEIPKPVPYTLKVPVPQPYTVEKHVPVPYKVTVDKPVPVQVPKPYPIYVEKKVPYTVEKHVPYHIKVPVEKPYAVPVHIEKPVPYPVEKPVPVPVKVPIDRPIPVHIERPYPVHVENPVPYHVEKFVPYHVQVPASEHHGQMPLFNYEHMRSQESFSPIVSAPNEHNYEGPNSYNQESANIYHQESKGNEQIGSELNQQANHNYNTESANNFHHESLIQPPPIVQQNDDASFHMQPPPLVIEPTSGSGNFSPSPKDPNETPGSHTSSGYFESVSTGKNSGGQSVYIPENHSFQLNHMPVSDIGHGSFMSGLNADRPNHKPHAQALQSSYLHFRSDQNSYMPVSLSEASYFPENHPGQSSHAPGISSEQSNQNSHGQTGYASASGSASAQPNISPKGTLGSHSYSTGISTGGHSPQYPNRASLSEGPSIHISSSPPPSQLPKLYEPVIPHKHSLNSPRPTLPTSEVQIHQQSFQTSTYHFEPQPLIQLPQEPEQLQSKYQQQSGQKENQQVNEQQSHDDQGIGTVQDDRIQQDGHQYNEPIESANTHVSQSFFQQLVPETHKPKVIQEEIIGIKPPNKPRYHYHHRHSHHKHPHTTQLYVIHQSDNRGTAKKGQKGVQKYAAEDPATSFSSVEHKSNGNKLIHVSTLHPIKLDQHGNNQQKSKITFKTIDSEDNQSNYQPNLNYNKDKMSDFIQQQEYHDIKKIEPTKDSNNAQQHRDQEKEIPSSENESSEIIFGTMKSFDKTQSSHVTPTQATHDFQEHDSDVSLPFLPTPMMLIRVPPKELQSQKITYIPEGNYSLQTTSVYPTQASSGGQVLALVATPQTAMQLMRYNRERPSESPAPDTTTPLRPDQENYPTEQIGTTDSELDTQTDYNEHVQPTVQMFIPNETPTPYYPMDPHVVSASMKVRVPFSLAQETRDTTPAVPTAETFVPDKNNNEGYSDVVVQPEEQVPPTRSTTKHRTKSSKSKARHSLRAKLQQAQDEGLDFVEYARVSQSGKSGRTKTKKRVPRPTKPTPTEEEMAQESTSDRGKQRSLSENPIVVPDQPQDEEMSRVHATHYQTEDEKGDEQIVQSKTEVVHPPVKEVLSGSATSYSEMRRNFGKRTRRLSKNNNFRIKTTSINETNSNSNNKES